MDAPTPKPDQADDDPFGHAEHVLGTWSAGNGATSFESAPRMSFQPADSDTANTDDPSGDPGGGRTPQALTALAKVTEVFRSVLSPTSAYSSEPIAAETLYASVARALSNLPQTRCLLFLISGDGTRMRVAADPELRNRGWQAAIGPVAQVLAARRSIEMGVVDDSFDPIALPTVRFESEPPPPVRAFGRFVPVFVTQRQWRTGESLGTARPSDDASVRRIVAVLALVRGIGEPLFRVEDRVVMDATAERFEMYLALRTASDAANGQRSTGVVSQNGLVIGDALLNRLGRISGDVIFRHLFATGTEYMSSGVMTSLGYTPEEVMGDPFLIDRSIYPEDRHVLYEIASGERSLDLPVLMRFLRRDGLISWQLLRVATITNDTGRILGVEGFATDVTVMKQAEATLLHQARSDPLTGLANRLNFREATTRGLARIERHPGMIGVLFLDLDGFKAVNDTMGHAAGDAVLKIVAERLRTVIRREDLVARLGGDEFAVLLSELRHESEGAASARRILEALEEPIVIDGQVASISSGVGISVTTSGLMTPDELINQADIALYQAKRSGRGRWQIFQGDNGSLTVIQGALPLGDVPVTVVDTVRASLTPGALRASFAGGEFRVYYLPQIDTVSGNIVAVEALVRWQHPVHGLLPASMFIGAAASSEVIHPLGDWVLREACTHVAEWRERFGNDLTLRVNVAVEQLARPGFAETILSVLASTGLSPRSLGLDVSESTITDLTPSQELTLDVLHRAGVGFAVDDFGTGSSSLRTLRRLPLSQIKIDRSLIDEVDRIGSNDEELVRLAIKLAGSLGAGVVAVGVERASQLERLRALQCAFFQGFLAGEARTADEITTILEHGQPQLPGLLV
jgi:diguanylate cyclase (GGDEF)-like protein/PAS domain S-box-containing protein